MNGDWLPTKTEFAAFAVGLVLGILLGAGAVSLSVGDSRGSVDWGSRSRIGDVDNTGARNRDGK